MKKPKKGYSDRDIIAYRMVLSLVPALSREIRKSRSALAASINAGLLANGLEPIKLIVSVNP